MKYDLIMFLCKSVPQICYRLLRMVLGDLNYMTFILKVLRLLFFPPKSFT